MAWKVKWEEIETAESRKVRRQSRTSNMHTQGFAGSSVAGSAAAITNEGSALIVDMEMGTRSSSVRVTAAPLFVLFRLCRIWSIVAERKSCFHQETTAILFEDTEKSEFAMSLSLNII